MTINDLISEFHTGYQFKKRTGLSQTSWHNWIEKGYIPIHSQFLIQENTNGKLVADFKHTPEGK